MATWVTTWFTFVPCFLLLGWNSLAWSFIIPAFFVIAIYVPIQAYLAAALPRSGGEQVYTSRITSPLLGFIESWTFAFGIFAFMGFAVSILVFNLSATFMILGFPSRQPWSSYASWLQGTTGGFYAGLFVLACIFVISMQPSKRFHTINSLLAGIGLVLSSIVIPFMFSLNYGTFAQNLQMLTGKSVNDIVNLAAGKGFSIGTFDMSVLGILLAFGIQNWYGFQFSSVIAGELKGNISRNVLISVGLVGLLVLFYGTVYLQQFVNVLGYNFLAAMSFLFYNAPSSAPFIPIVQVLITINQPQLGPLMAISVLTRSC